MATDSTIRNVTSTTIRTGTIFHMCTSMPLRFDYRKIYVFIEPGFEIVYDGSSLHQTNRYSYYDQFSRAFVEYSRDSSDSRIAGVTISGMFKIGFGVYWNDFELGLNNYNFSSVGLSICWNFRNYRHNPESI
jgi:hypothetical protein